MKQRVRFGLFALMILGLVVSCNKNNGEDCGLDNCDLSGNFLCNITHEKLGAGVDSSLTRSTVVQFYLVNQVLYFDQYSIPIPEDDKDNYYHETADGLTNIRVGYLENFNTVVVTIKTYSSPGVQNNEVVIVGDRTSENVSQNANAYHAQFNGEYEVYVEKKDKLNYGSTWSESTTETLTLQIEEDRVLLGDSVMYIDKPFHDRWVKTFFSLDADTVRSSNYFSINPNSITFKMEWGVLNEDENIEGKEVLMTAVL